MPDRELLERLRRLRGIEDHWFDFRGERREVSSESLASLLEAMGHSVSDPEALAREADALEAREWTRVLPPVAVIRHGRDSRVPLTVMFPLMPGVRWRVAFESGGETSGQVELHPLERFAEHAIDALHYVRLGMPLPGDLPLGYHRLFVEKLDGERLGDCRLIVAPERCYQPPSLSGGERIWGMAVQLYTLRSERNWGIGDFTDLAEFAAAAAGLGADFVGLNPLHALFPADPEMASPYSPSSRKFINVLYIDPEKVPCFDKCAHAVNLVADPAFKAKTAALRETAGVDYTGVTQSKMAVLEAVHAGFHSQATKAELDAYGEFVARHGEALQDFALFHAMQARAAAAPPGQGAWPADYAGPASPEAQAFTREHPGEVEFHAWLQWVAAEQLAATEKAARDAGMSLGIYRDLAVGVSGGGAEAWSDPDLYTAGASVGAPPDPLALQGQDWGIPPMLPDVLRERAYQPIAELFSSNMGRGGALRIDHVMVLFRLWWVPAGQPSSAGSYVYYRLDDLFAILALESHRRQCLVIGEDLGTVPEEIRKAMPDYGVWSYRVFYFEHAPDGRCRAPEDYPPEALVTISTHDLPPLTSYWTQSDIDLREQLELYPEEGMADGARAERQRDLQRILDALAERELISAERRDLAAHPDLDPELLSALIRYLGQARAGVAAVQLEDWIGLDTPVNVPGTGDEYANWRRKLPQTWERLLEREDVWELARILGNARGS